MSRILVIAVLVSFSQYVDSSAIPDVGALELDRVELKGSHVTFFHDFDDTVSEVIETDFLFVSSGDVPPRGAATILTLDDPEVPENMDSPVLRLSVIRCLGSEQSLLSVGLRYVIEAWDRETLVRDGIPTLEDTYVDIRDPFWREDYVDFELDGFAAKWERGEIFGLFLSPTQPLLDPASCQFHGFDSAHPPAFVTPWSGVNLYLPLLRLDVTGSGSVLHQLR